MTRGTFNPERLLMALSGEVAELRTTVADLARQVEELPAPPPAGAPTLADLNGRLDELTTQLADVAALAERATTGGSPATGPVWDWTRLDAETASNAWNQLAWWVPNVLLARNPLLLADGDRWASCWYAHPDVVDELSALYGVWWEAFYAKDASAARVAEWRDRWLPGALRRIADSSMQPCITSYDGHRPVEVKPSRQTPPDDLVAFVHRDLAARTAPQ